MAGAKQARRAEIDKRGCLCGCGLSPFRFPGLCGVCFVMYDLVSVRQLSPNGARVFVHASESSLCASCDALSLLSPPYVCIFIGMCEVRGARRQIFFIPPSVTKRKLLGCLQFFTLCFSLREHACVEFHSFKGYFVVIKTENHRHTNNAVHPSLLLIFRRSCARGNSSRRGGTGGVYVEHGGDKEGREEGERAKSEANHFRCAGSTQGHPTALQIPTV